MITTMFWEKSNMYHISEPMITRLFFPNLCHFVLFRAVFIDSFSFAMKHCNTSQGFGAFFFQSCDRFLLPFYPFSHFSLSFLIFLNKNSSYVFNKTIILLGLAGYQMIITNSALRASLVIYHFISSAPS